MTILEMRDTGETFVPADPKPKVAYAQIPKSNKRFVELSSEIIEERTIELSVSSAAPYLRWFGYEELDHSEAAVNLERFNDGAQVLFNHNRDEYIGIIESAWLDGNRLYNRIKFDTHELAEKIYSSIRSGIVKNVSIGYVIEELKMTGQRDGHDVYRATRWTPFETSIVTVPADFSVGIGRSYFVSESRENSEEGLRARRTRLGTPDVVEEIIEKAEVMSEAVEINENDIRQQERDRVSGIHALGKKYGHGELASRAINDGLSIVEARSLYLDKVKSADKPVAASLNPVDLPNKEATRYSFLKAIGFAAGKVKADDAGLELEVSDHIQNTRMGGKPPEGIYVDQTRLVSFRAPYDTQTPAAASNLISTDLLADRFIEALYNQSAFLSAGVTYLRDLTGNIEIPREDTFTNGYWIGEGLPITEDEGTFDKITLSPKKLACLSKVTYEMIHQSSIDLEQLMRSRLIRGLALELDRTIGFGSGIGEEPLGIVSHPEVLSIVLGANGGRLDWAGYVDMQAAVDNANAMMGNDFCYVINSRTKATAMKTLDHDTGTGNWIWQNGSQGDGIIAGYAAKCSNQIPNNLIKGSASNLTAAFFGDFSKVLMGIWAGLDVMVDPYSESSNAIIKIIAKQLVDIQLSRGQYFCVATDVQNN